MFLDIAATMRCNEGQIAIFVKKNAFFGQKKAFFQKVHFIQKCSVTQNTIFQCIKNNFLLSNPKLVFFTEFNLHIKNLITHDLVTYDRAASTRNRHWRVVSGWFLNKDP